MALSYHSQVPKFFLRDQKNINEWILLVAFIEKKEIENVSFIFCNDRFLLDLNKKFLYRHTFTDIITFDYSDKKKIEAEIYISVLRVKENAKKFEAEFDDELRRVMIHGILHCCGYTDKESKDKVRIRKLEDRYLSLFTSLQ